MVSSRKDLKLLCNPSCGAQNMAVWRHILTAAPSSPRCICHRQRSATKPGTRFWGCMLYSLHCVIMICLITCKSLIYQRFLVHILKIQAVSINHRKLKVLEKVLKKEQKKIKPYTTKWLYINGRGRRTWSRLPARSVLLHFVQRSPPETRTPQHAPRASESKSFYSMPKQKRSPFGNRFRFGRGRRTWTLGTRFWRPLLYQLSYTPILNSSLRKSLWYYTYIASFCQQ